MFVDLFDPGDGNSGTDTVQILAPPSGAPSLVPITGSAVPCSYSDPSSTIGAAATVHSSPTCLITTRNPSASLPIIYNNGWLRIAVPIPTAYTCFVDCWWTMSSVYSSSPTDRVVYKVSFSGS